MITSVYRGIDKALVLTTDLGHTKVRTVLPNFTGDSDAAVREHQYRVEQLSPQPKVEFERDPEDYDD